MDLAFLHEVFPLDGKIHLFYLFGEKYYLKKKNLESSLILIFFKRENKIKKKTLSGGLKCLWVFLSFVEESVESQ